MKKTEARHYLENIKLETYGISQSIGFLPEPDPLVILPQHVEYFRRLNKIREYTPRYFGTTGFRRTIDELSSYFLVHVEKSTCGELQEIERELQNPRNARLAKLILGSLIQAYVLGSPHENVLPHIPEGIAKPMVFVSKFLDVPPILAYQDYALANWERLDCASPVQLGNLMVLQYLLGGLDEAWFILVHVDIEMRMGKVPAAGLALLRGIKNQDTEAIARRLTEIKYGFDAMNATFLRMPEYCSSNIFYERVRPYIHGQKMNPALPNGVIYEGVYIEPKSYYGETGAQSSIIPLCVALLGIKYPNDWLSKYVDEMHAYMPKGHRDLISDISKLEKHYSVQNFILKHRNTHPFLVDLFLTVLEGGRTFLEQHARFATEYIHRQSAKSTAANPHNIGTGGSDFMTTLMRHAECWRCEALHSDIAQEVFLSSLK